APLLDRERIVDKGVLVAFLFLGTVFGPALVAGLEGVVAVIQVELFVADGRRADHDIDDLVDLTRAALAAVGPEAINEDAQRAAGGAARAARAKEHVPEVTPATEQALEVLLGTQRRDVLVLQAPDLIGQV